MIRAKSVEDYIEQHANWQNALEKLRKILLQSRMQETIKWGAPCYCVNNKNIVGIGAFKQYVALWFFNGALLKDPSNVLVNAQEGKTKALRQWRFQSVDDMNESVIKAYIKEAIELQEKGKTVKHATPSKKLELPTELLSAINEDRFLKQQFLALANYKQREYAEHIAGAKRESTRLSRLEKSILLIKQGAGLNDKYRNC